MTLHGVETRTGHGRGSSFVGIDSGGCSKSGTIRGRVKRRVGYGIKVKIGIAKWKDEKGIVSRSRLRRRALPHLVWLRYMRYMPHARKREKTKEAEVLYDTLPTI